MLALSIALLTSGCSGGASQTPSLLGAITLGAITSVSATAYSLWPGSATLPDGKMLAIYQVGVVGSTINTNLCTKSGVTVTCASPIAFTLPAGYTANDQSLALLSNNTLFLSLVLVQTSSGNSYPAYAIGTIGGGDAITWGTTTILSALTGIPAGYTTDVQAPSPVIQTGAASLLLPIYATNDSSGLQISGYITFASLSGGTPSAFTQIGPNPVTNSMYNESAGVVLADGHLALLLRHANDFGGESGNYSISISPSATTPSFPTPTDGVINSGGIIGRPALLSPDGVMLVAVGRCAPQNANEISSTTCAWISHDEGYSWSTLSDVGMGLGMDHYDSLNLWQDGSIGLVQSYDNGGINVVGYSTLSL